MARRRGSLILPQNPYEKVNQHPSPVIDNENEEREDDTHDIELETSIGVSFTSPVCTRLTVNLQNRGSVATTSYSAIVVAMMFFLLYGFRRPWAAASEFNGMETVCGLPPKVWLFISHLIGFVIGKYTAAKFLVSFKLSQYFYVLIAIPMLCLTAWIGFGFSNGKTIQSAIALFFTGLPMAWSYPACYRFIEGRNNGAIIAALLTSGYTVGSGVAKAMALYLIEIGVPEFWMPMLTGLIYLAPAILFACLLVATPPPSPEEIENNNPRKPMSNSEQTSFLREYWPGLCMLVALEVISFVLLTFRDLFQTEIWKELYADRAMSSGAVMSTEIPVTIMTVVSLATLNIIGSNRLSVIIQHAIFVISGISMFLFQFLFEANVIGPTIWYIGLGYTLMMVYSPLTSIFADRLFGALKIHGTATFTMNIASMMTNIGMILLLLVKSVYSEHIHTSESPGDKGYVSFFSYSVYIVSIGIVFLSIGSVFAWWSPIHPDTLVGKDVKTCRTCIV